jgi:hypothetical protein
MRLEETRGDRLEARGEKKEERRGNFDRDHFDILKDFLLRADN